MLIDPSSVANEAVSHREHCCWSPALIMPSEAEWRAYQLSSGREACDLCSIAPKIAAGGPLEAECDRRPISVWEASYDGYRSRPADPGACSTKSHDSRSSYRSSGSPLDGRSDQRWLHGFGRPV